MYVVVSHCGFNLHSLTINAEKAMAPHSSTLAWKIPWTEEPGRLQSMGLLSWTRLSNFTFTFHFHALEKEMATHSSVLAWRIPGTGEPVGLPSMGSHRVGHDWSDLAAAAFMIWASQVTLMVKNPPANAVDAGMIPGLERSHGEGNAYPLYFCLGNSSGQMRPVICSQMIQQSISKSMWL